MAAGRKLQHSAVPEHFPLGAHPQRDAGRWSPLKSPLRPHLPKLSEQSYQLGACEPRGPFSFKPPHRLSTALYKLATISLLCFYGLVFLYFTIELWIISLKHNVASFHSFCHKWQDVIVFYGWGLFCCMWVAHSVTPFTDCMQKMVPLITCCE